MRDNDPHFIDKNYETVRRVERIMNYYYIIVLD